MSPSWCFGHIHSHPAGIERVSDSQQPSPRIRRVKNIVPFNWIQEKPASLHTYNWHNYSKQKLFKYRNYLNSSMLLRNKNGKERLRIDE